MTGNGPFDEIQHDPVSPHPTGLSGLPVRDIIAAVREWFGDNFEDPSEHTPRDDGDFVYIWGGPYDTRDIIENIFADDLTEMEIEEVVAALERHSSEWVPSQRRLQPPEDYYEESDTVAPRSAGDLHARMLALIAEAEERLDSVAPGAADELPAHWIGHNRPPEPINDAPLSRTEIEAVRAALSALKAQPPEPDSEGQKISETANVLIQSTTGKIAAWAKDRVSDFAVEFFKELGKKAAGALSIYTLWQMLGGKLTEVAHAASHWLMTVNPPF